MQPRTQEVVSIWAGWMSLTYSKLYRISVTRDGKYCDIFEKIENIGYF